jgi:hypothetical protein
LRSEVDAAMRALSATLLCLLLGAPALAQSPAEPGAQTIAWSYYAAVNAYFPPGDDYLSPVFMADRERLHLEARYNYEGQDTASVWAGFNFESADGETWAITPILGGVFGDTEGVAVGVEGSFAWKRVAFYTEGEHLFSSDPDEDDFTYFWSELTLSPVEWLRAGFVSQRTRAYETDVDVMRGILVGVMHRSMSLTVDLFEPGSDDETFVVTAGVEF